MDTQNNPAPEIKQQPQKTETPDHPEPKPQPAEQMVFFNVMPKVQGAGEIVDPKMKLAVSNTQTVAAPGFMDKVKKYKKYIFIVVGAIALIALGYYLIQKIGAGAYKSDVLLVKQPNGQTAKPKPQTPEQVEGFTTTKEWRDKYFASCEDVLVCGDSADPDGDGLANIDEFKLNTDPNNSDSDQDGLADGDEVNVFGSDPLNSHTANQAKFSDADFLKGGFNIQTNKKMSAVEIATLSSKMKQAGLHQPTITTLASVLVKLYNFTLPAGSPAASSAPESTASTTGASNLDQSVEAKQSRDAQRSETIKNIEIALVKFNTDNKTYPDTADFNVMFLAVKLYLKVATNPIDPINKPPFVYGYSSIGGGTDFLLTFYSEVAGQLIKKNAADAVKVASVEQASIYDNQRETDLESIRTALLLYSQNNISGSQEYVFPTKAKYKTSIVPEYISEVPVDPKSGAAYDYEVSPTFNTFTLKTPLDNPPVGTTGYVCNQDSCQDY